MKMNRYIQLVILILLTLLCIWTIGGFSRPKQNESGYNISVIIRGKMDESRDNLKKGAENAAEDLHVTLRFVAAIEGNTAQEQIDLLYQEAEGTDAILISPVDQTALKNPISDVIHSKIPVILVESGISEKNTFLSIHCDNEALGRGLARSVINYGNQKEEILVLCGDARCTSVADRRKGFLENMKETKNRCSILHEGGFSSEDILSQLKEKEPDVAVALDTDVLKNLVKASKDYKTGYPNASLQIFGAGCSSEVLKELENKNIVTIAAEDDFSIGYLGIQEAVAAIEGKGAKSNSKIHYIITNSDHMYDDENQKLLFPFVK